MGQAPEVQASHRRILESSAEKLGAKFGLDDWHSDDESNP